MIKVTCKDSTDPVKSEYPCLKKSEGTGRIILFISPKSGCELEGGKKNPTDFYYSENWIEEDFQPYHGTVELSNVL